ncbi:TPA_asm: hypothetical protein, partial [ssRNA phage SRR6960551_13]
LRRKAKVSGVDGLCCLRSRDLTLVPTGGLSPNVDVTLRLDRMVLPKAFTKDLRTAVCLWQMMAT